MELRDFYSRLHVMVMESRIMDLRDVTLCGEKRNAYRVGKPQRKRLLGRRRRELKDYVKLDLKDM
jgi:hypothetical protein